MPKFEINPNQNEAILHTKGPARILAGPGSGKTYVITNHILHLINNLHIDPNHILVISFTKAATKEMMQRFLKNPKADTYNVRFGTFHSIFFTILRQSPKYCKFSIVNRKQKLLYLKQVLKNNPMYTSRIQESDIPYLLQLIDKHKETQAISSTLIEQEALRFFELQAEEFYYFEKEYFKLLNENKLFDFEDIHIFCEELLMEDKKILKKWQEVFSYILIDEFQDISPIQYRIIKLLALPENNLFIVGDDDQSIYGFRGSNPNIMQQFMYDFPSAKEILLDINYRCHKEIIKASLKMIQGNHDRVIKEMQGVHTIGDGVILKFFKAREEEIDFIINQLSYIRKKKALQETAVLCRTNWECIFYAQFLEKESIPYHLHEKLQSRFSNAAVQDLITYMKLACGDRRRASFLKILNRPMRYINRTSIMDDRVDEKKWLVYYEENLEIQAEIQKLFQDLEKIKSKSPYLGARYIRQKMGYDTFLKEQFGYQRANKFYQMEDTFCEFLKQFKNYNDFFSYLEMYTEMQNKEELSTDNIYIPKEDAVTLLTMHASKGLEFKYVFIPGCEEGKIPSRNIQSQSDLEEERRMLYVAMTRAKESLYITAVNTENGKEKLSRFLKELNMYPL